MRAKAVTTVGPYSAEFLQRSGIHQTGHQVPRIVLRTAVGGDDLVQVLGIAGGRASVIRLARGAGQQVDERTQPRQTSVVVRFAIVGRAADFGVHPRAAELLGIGRLPDGSLHQGRASQIDLTAFGHEHGVGEHGQIGAAGDAVAHDGGVLWNAHRRDDGIVAEDAPEVVLVGEDFILQGQEDARRIDQINQRQAKSRRDALRAQTPS